MVNHKDDHKAQVAEDSPVDVLEVHFASLGQHSRDMHVELILDVVVIMKDCIGIVRRVRMTEELVRVLFQVLHRIKKLLNLLQLVEKVCT